MELASAQVELVESSGGVFEVSRDGKLLFSKKPPGRFPTDQEVDVFAAKRRHGLPASWGRGPAGSFRSSLVGRGRVTILT